MNKNSSFLIYIIIFISNVSSLPHQLEPNIDSILKIKPPTNYYQSLKYQEIKKYQDVKDNEVKSDYDFGFNLDINKEEHTIDGIKIDIGTHF